MYFIRYCILMIDLTNVGKALSKRGVYGKETFIGINMLKNYYSFVYRFQNCISTKGRLLIPVGFIV